MEASPPTGRALVKVGVVEFCRPRGERMLDYAHTSVNFGSASGVGRDAYRGHDESGLEVADPPAVAGRTAIAPPRCRNSTDASGDPEPCPASATSASTASGGTSLSSIPFPRQGVDLAGLNCSANSVAGACSQILSSVGPRSRNGAISWPNSSMAPW